MKYTKRNLKKPTYDKFAIIDDKLVVYEPKKLIVIENEEQKYQVLEDLFNQDENTTGKGFTNFYKYVTSKYINNIKREEVKLYLQTKGFFQMTQNINKMERWIVPKCRRFNKKCYLLPTLRLDPKPLNRCIVPKSRRFTMFR